MAKQTIRFSSIDRDHPAIQALNPSEDEISFQYEAGFEDFSTQATFYKLPSGKVLVHNKEQGENEIYINPCSYEELQRG